MQTTLNKLTQVFSLVTCLLMMLSVAIVRDGKVWGTPLGEQKAQDTGTAMTARGGSIVVNTTSLANDITGYGGNVPLEITVKNGVITDITPLENAETPSFFERATVLLDQWKGKTVEEARTLQVDAVSGATFSSKAIIGNMQRGLAHIERTSLSADDTAQGFDLSPKTVAGIIVALMAALLPLFVKNRKYQILQMILNVTVLGFWCGTFLSYAAVINWLSGGFHILTGGIPAILIVTAFVYPLFGKKSYYCTHVCPFGSLQELAGKCTRHKLKLGTGVIHKLDTFRQLLWAVLMLLLYSGVWASWTDYEPFAAFIVESASGAVIDIAATFIVLSVIVRRPYCRFVCPMGTLFKLSQSSK